ncbi:MAG: protein kinase [Clostridia bacterium]|nr:protein kinase [Clostridia bacterium]
MIGRVLDNRYELVEFVGKGGMAIVYRAIDHRTGHSVAVKILQPEFNQDAEFLGRFEREAMTASKMSHHNIVNLLDVGQDKEIRFLVMEYVRGRTLKEVIRQKGALPPAVAAQIGIRILSALQHAHNNGIIHRDIKPQNILVHSDGHIKVADFGIARVAGSNTISTEDSVMGSVHYFSPEQAKGESVTNVSDLYSVGVTLYEMMTGQPPFDGETPVAIALQHIGTKAKPMGEINPAVPPAMERVVEKAMEKRPEKRYQNALEMAQDLQRALQEPDGTWLGRLPDKPIPVMSTPTGKQRALKKRKRRLYAMGAALAVAAAVLIGLSIAVFKIYDEITNVVEAPYCRDEVEKDALRLIERSGLRYEIIRTSDNTAPTGTVIGQIPDYGAKMRKNDPKNNTIRLIISTGPEEKPVPDFVGMGLEEAREEAEAHGFTLLPMPRRELSNTPWGTVLHQNPEAENLMLSNGVIEVYLSGGSVTLPDLTGMPLSDALLLIQQLDLNLIEIKQIPVSDTTQFDRVATQQYSDADYNQYSPGQQAMQQTQVTLAVYVSDQPGDGTAQPVQTPIMEGEAQ